MWESRHRSLTKCFLGCTQRKCQISKDIVDNYERMFEYRISAVAVENTRSDFQGNLRQTLYLHSPMTRNVMRRNAWKHVSNLLTWLGFSCRSPRSFIGLPRSFAHLSISFSLLRRPSMVIIPLLSSLLRKNFPQFVHDNSQDAVFRSLPTSGLRGLSSFSAIVLQGF